jgi:hypothetical protein
VAQPGTNSDHASVVFVDCLVFSIGMATIVAVVRTTKHTLVITPLTIVAEAPSTPCFDTPCRVLR